MRSRRDRARRDGTSAFGKAREDGPRDEKPEPDAGGEHGCQGERSFRGDHPSQSAGGHADKTEQAEDALAVENACRGGDRRDERGDVLLSTLRNYLVAAGAADPRIVVSVNGHDVVVDLTAIAERA